LWLAGFDPDIGPFRCSGVIRSKVLNSTPEHLDFVADFQSIEKILFSTSPHELHFPIDDIFSEADSLLSSGSINHFGPYHDRLPSSKSITGTAQFDEQPRPVGRDAIDRGAVRYGRFN
jgi:hypothetical protein